MRLERFAILAVGLLMSCNVSNTTNAVNESGVSIVPRLMLAHNQTLPVTDSVYIKLWSTNPSKVWYYENTLAWSAKYVVIKGVPSGIDFQLTIEGRKKQSDGTSAVWWFGSQTGSSTSPQTLDAVDVPVWVTIGDTVSPAITGLRDTVLDSAVTGVRLRWTVVDSALSSVWSGSKRAVMAGDVATDSVSVSVGASVEIKVRAYDNAGNLSTKSIQVSRRSKGNGTTSGATIPWNESINYDTLKDDRDGKSYRTIMVGRIRWMAENLNYSGQGTSIGSCYGGSADSCTKYGRLYKWNETMDGASTSSAVPSGRRGVCPVGWHVPSMGEWDSLEAWVSRQDGASIASVGKMLKASSGWAPASGNGTDQFGFRFLPSGANDPSKGYRSVGGSGSAWSSSESGAMAAYDIAMLGHMDAFYRYASGEDKNYGFSLRCVDNSAYGLDSLVPKDSVIPKDASTIGLWNMNEGAGASIKNSVTGTNGSLHGGYSWVNGKFGKAIQFDGVSGYADLGFDPLESNSTFEMIVRIQRDTGWLFSLWGAYNSGLALSSKSVTIPYFSGESQSLNWDSAKVLYVATTLNSSRFAKAYINGVAVDSGTATDPYSWSSTMLASYTGTSEFVKCVVEKVRISSVVRSDVEIQGVAKKIGLYGSILK